MTYGLRQRGDKYRFGAEGPNRWDCSGLVWFSYRKAGLGHLPRTSRQQYRAVRHIKPMRLQRGDLMFFHTRKGRVYHVAIFLGWRHGHRLMLHAPKPGERVQRARPWTHHFWAGTLRHRSSTTRHTRAPWYLAPGGDPPGASGPRDMAGAPSSLAPCRSLDLPASRWPRSPR